MERPDIIFEDFENGNFENWQVLGTTFFKPMQKDSIGFEVKNIHGDFLAISTNENPDDQKSQGKLVSREFTIDRNYINVLVGGGNHIEREAINLIIDNKIVMSVTGRNDNVLRSVSWKVNHYIGKRAVIEIVDALSTLYNENALPYLIVDNIVFSDRTNSSRIVFDDFESGTYNDWNIEGSAFEKPRNRINVYYPISVSGFGGDFFAFSFGETHDEKKGKLTSRDFVINHDFIKFLIAGGDHKDKTCINLVVKDSVIYSQTGKKDANMRSYIWDVSDYKGEHAKLEIVDDYTGTWGHIMVDDIVFYNENNGKQIFAMAMGTVTFLGLLFFVVYRIRSKRKVTGKPKTGLTEGESQEIERIKALIKERALFINPNPSITDLAQVAEMEVEDLNCLFEKSQYGSLTNYINLLRVEEFKRELKDPSNEVYTLLAIAHKCGFSSKSSFYRIFKNITNITPSDYKRTLGK